MNFDDFEPSTALIASHISISGLKARLFIFLKPFLYMNYELTEEVEHK